MGYHNESIYCSEDLADDVKEHVKENTDADNLSEYTRELWKQDMQATDTDKNEG